MKELLRINSVRHIIIHIQIHTIVYIFIATIVRI